MSHLPFLIRTTKPVPSAGQQLDFIPTVVEEDLPAVLEFHAEGYAVAGRSRITEVNRETTDDT